MTARPAYTRRVAAGVEAMLGWARGQGGDAAAAAHWLAAQVDGRPYAGGVLADPVLSGSAGHAAMVAKTTEAQRRRWARMGGRPRNRTLAEILADSVGVRAAVSKAGPDPG